MNSSGELTEEVMSIKPSPGDTVTQSDVMKTHSCS